jgi:glutathione S-transferase
MLRVLGRVSSINVRKVLWTLDELGVDYEREDWGKPLRDPQSPEFLDLNPNGQVPVLVNEDGSALWESNSILIHLALSHGALMPSDPAQAGKALQWLIWQVSELNPTWVYAVYALLRKEPGFDEPAKIAESIERWSQRMKILEGELAGSGPFIAGDALTIADIALGLSIHRWLKAPFEHPPLPAVEAYYQRLRATPGGARYMADDLF